MRPPLFNACCRTTLRQAPRLCFREHSSVLLASTSTNGNHGHRLSNLQLSRRLGIRLQRRLTLVLLPTSRPSRFLLVHHPACVVCPSPQSCSSRSMPVSSNFAALPTHLDIPLTIQRRCNSRPVRQSYRLSSHIAKAQLIHHVTK